MDAGVRAGGRALSTLRPDSIVCGIAGFWSSTPIERDEKLAYAERMAESLRPRGPDDGGTWTDNPTSPAFAFRRLAIIDLSEAGHQPMVTLDGRVALVFNGEIYNWRAIRPKLEAEGCRFRGQSDTEVVLNALAVWGVDRTLQCLEGMFALASWNTETRELVIARDRLGIKPLFVHATPGFVSFGSELKALLAGPQFDRSLDPTAIDDFLRNLYVPAPKSIFANVKKLLPGHVLKLRTPGPVSSEAYWTLEQAARTGLQQRSSAPEGETISEFGSVLADVVSSHLESDVPLGAFLSGGIDSSLVVALAQKAVGGGLRTFSVAFDEKDHDESAHAAAVAAHLGTKHTEIRLPSTAALDLVDALPNFYDEPFADPSQLPTLMVCRAAREHVTVALSGDGGDELFAGYNRYRYGLRTFSRVERAPSWVRHGVASGLSMLSTEGWDNVYSGATRLLASKPKQRLFGQKVAKLARLLDANSVDAMYDALVTVWPADTELVRDSRVGPHTAPPLAGSDIDGITLLERMLLHDQMGSLADDQLAKADRASMSTGLEVRVPLLDRRVVEWSWRLAPSLKLREQETKYALRQVLYQHVPRELIERPKVGFSVPIGPWLRGPLRAWADQLFATHLPAIDNVLNASAISAAWRRVLAGDDSEALGIWAALMLRSWSNRWLQ